MTVDIVKSGQNVAAGGGGDPAKVGGVLHVTTTDTATIADTNETDLASYTLPANTLSNNGMALKVKAYGITAANGNDKTLKLYFGTLLLDTTALALNSQDWIIEALIVRSGVGGQDVLTQFARGATAAVNNETVRTEDETTGLEIKVTGENGTASAGDITFKGMVIEFLNF